MGGVTSHSPMENGSLIEMNGDLMNRRDVKLLSFQVISFGGGRGWFDFWAYIELRCHKNGSRLARYYITATASKI